MTTRTLILAALALAAALRAAAQLAYTFDAECSRPAQHDIPVMRGESVTVAPRLVLRGAPVDISGMVPTFLYQTNGMADAWWSLPAALDPAETGRVSAVWSHTNDLGAAAYNWFIGLSQGGTATTYRAAGRIVMRHAPGFTPNSIPLPVPVLDFSRISVLNPPWPSAADLQAVRNALAASVQPLGPRLDAVEAWPTNDWRAAYSWGDHALAGYLLPAALAPYATTQQVADAAAAIPRDRITTIDGSQWIDATGGVWRVTSSEGFWRLTVAGTQYGCVTNASYDIPAIFSIWQGGGMVRYWSADGNASVMYDGVSTDPNIHTTVRCSPTSVETNYNQFAVYEEDLDDGSFEFYSDGTYTHIILEWFGTPVSATQRVDGVAWQSDLSSYATTQALAAALAPLATTQQVAEAVSGALTNLNPNLNLNLYAVPAAGGKHELWVKE